MLNTYRSRLRRILPAAIMAFAEVVFGLVGFAWTMFCFFCCILMFAGSAVIVNDHVLPWVSFWPDSWYHATSLTLAVPMTMVGFILLELVGLILLVLAILILVGFITLMISGWQKLTGKGSPTPPTGRNS